jgi:hypothetical protein
MMHVRSDRIALAAVMPALVASIHAKAREGQQEDVDGRDEPGHDGNGVV